MRGKRFSGLRGILPGFALSLGLSFLVCIYAPFELYLTNREEFWFRASQMLPYTLGLFFAALLVLCLCFLLARKLGSGLVVAGTALLAFVLLAVYIQGTFLVAGLPGMDGTRIDMNAYPELRLQSVLCWGGSAALTALLLWRLGSARFTKYAGFFGAGLTLLLALSLVGLVLTNLEPKRTVLASTDLELLNMSEEENLIVVHLDAVDAGMFEEVIAGDGVFQEGFRDFTYFDNTLSGYSSTKCSVPLILTSQWYEPSRSFTEYADEAMSGSPLFSGLRDRGYRLAVYDLNDFYLSRDLFDGVFENMREDDPVVASDKGMTAMMVRMALVKFAPWDLKRPGFNLQSKLADLRAFRGGVGYGYYDWGNALFYSRLNEPDPIRLRDGKSFKYIELEGAHNPYIYDRYVQLSPGADYRSSVECSLTIALELIRCLKDCGIYDNTALVFMADHGYNTASDDTNFCQHPLLMIKGRGEQHPLAVNNAPISHVDMCGAFLRLADGAAADSCFDWQSGQARERRFLRYDWRDLTRFEEYWQSGQAEDMSTMVLHAVLER